MTTTTTTKTTCDICNKTIEPNEQRVFAGSYGLDFHLICLDVVDGTIIGLLVDDVEVGQSKEFEGNPNHASRLYWNHSQKIS